MSPAPHRTISPRFKTGILSLAAALCLLFSLNPNGAGAQVPDTIAVSPPDTLIHPVDEDTLVVTPPEAPAEIDVPPAQQPPGNGRLAGAIRFTARDSLVLHFNDDGDLGRLTGNARVQYEDMTLDAHEIDILFARDELRARGEMTSAGIIEGRPHFEKGSESFTGAEIAYNLRTDRGRVVGARTAVEDGFLLGRVIKAAGDTVIYVEQGMYTTCDLEHDPHYTLRASRMKIVDQEWIYSGPIHLRIFNIPLPVWLPFGFLPATEGRRSGPLAPSYGEDERGFYLRDLGWYWAMNDYMDFQTRFGIWSRGSWQIAPMYRYASRYRFSGEIQLDWTRNRRGERIDPDFLVQDTRSLRWRHDQTIDPTSRLAGNVDLSSTGYLRTVSDLYDDRVRQTIGSNISYNKRWPTAGRSVNVSLNHRQQLATGATNLTLPNLSFSQGTRNPFRRERRAGFREQWYERIAYSYSATLNNRFNYVPLSPELAEEVSWWDALISPSAYRRATGRTDHLQFEATHRVPISAPFSIERLPLLNVPFRLNFSPNINYSENWFLHTQRRELRAVTDTTSRVETFSVPGFFALRQFNMGVGASTEFFGMFPFRIGSFEGFRHTVRPNLSFSYTPDYSAPFWGYYRTVVDEQGRVTEYPIVPGVPRGQQQVMGINISNVFQGRQVWADTLGERRSRVVNLLNVDANTAYNFTADSLRLGNVNVTARTRLFDQLEINAGSQFSPYATNEQGMVVDRWFLNDTGWPLRLLGFNLSARTQLRSRQAQGQPRPFTTTRARIGDRLNGDPDRAFEGVVQDPFMSNYFNTPVGYADFAIPWSLNLDLTYRMSRFGVTTTRSAIVNTRFDFNLTPNWKIQGASGYDLTSGEFVTTNITVMRDLHCWEMSFNWVPFGLYQSFGFTIQVKSGHLRDILRLQQPRTDIRNRFGQLL